MRPRLLSSTASNIIAWVLYQIHLLLLSRVFDFIKKGGLNKTVYWRGQNIKLIFYQKAYQFQKVQNTTRPKESGLNMNFEIRSPAVVNWLFPSWFMPRLNIPKNASDIISQYQQHINFSAIICFHPDNFPRAAPK